MKNIWVQVGYVKLAYYKEMKAISLIQLKQKKAHHTIEKKNKITMLILYTRNSQNKLSHTEIYFSHVLKECSSNKPDAEI